MQAFRRIAVTNLSTLLIYGALYVTFYYLVLFQQGTIGYTAAAAAASNGISTYQVVLVPQYTSATLGAVTARVSPVAILWSTLALMPLFYFLRKSLTPESATPS